jgi:hypothetical protein
MQKMSEKYWITISNARIFFGHQSVGYNIVDGINDLKNESHSSLFTILETRRSADFQHPVFAHSAIGKNLDPVSKIDDFVNILESGLADSVDIAFMKLCYVDFNRHTDINRLFEYYQNAMGNLQKKYPHVKIIHFTAPLTIKPQGLKGFVKILLKMDPNTERNKYNELIRNHYSDSELFDIAKIESTFPDGSANTYVGGIPGLVPGYASDGRHLNQQGRLRIASELIKFLAEKN